MAILRGVHQDSSKAGPRHPESSLQQSEQHSHTISDGVKQSARNALIGLVLVQKNGLRSPVKLLFCTKKVSDQHEVQLSLSFGYIAREDDGAVTYQDFRMMP